MIRSVFLQLSKKVAKNSELDECITPKNLPNIVVLYIYWSGNGLTQ